MQSYKDRFWMLAGLKLAGEATEAEAAELDALLEQSPELLHNFEMLQHVWQMRPTTDNSRREKAFERQLQKLDRYNEQQSSHYATVQQQVQEERRRIISVRVRNWSVAVAACVAAVIFLLFYQGHDAGVQNSSAKNAISTKPGSKSKIQLPDGSTVWLNADSRLVYNETFTGPIREVELSGEAYFDVVKDKAHPFIIHTRALDIRVLGTAFNVRAYANEKNIETSLIRGLVEVTLHNNADKKIILRPNEKLTVNGDFSTADTQHIAVKHLAVMFGKVHFHPSDSSATETLWVKNKLVFEEQTLQDIALTLSRWYNVKVTVADSSLLTHTYSGVFEDESLQQVMEALKLAGHFRYFINHHEVIIQP